MSMLVGEEILALYNFNKVRKRVALVRLCELFTFWMTFPFLTILPGETPTLM